jgi:hypothetical protein
LGSMYIDQTQAATICDVLVAVQMSDSKSL